MLRIRLLALSIPLLLLVSSGCSDDPVQPDDASAFAYAGTWRIHSIDGVEQIDTILYRFYEGSIVFQIDTSIALYTTTRNADSITVTRSIDGDSITPHPAALDSLNQIVKQGDTLHVYTPGHHLRLVRMVSSDDFPAWLEKVWAVTPNTQFTIDAIIDWANFKGGDQQNHFINHMYSTGPNQIGYTVIHGTTDSYVQLKGVSDVQVTYSSDNGSTYATVTLSNDRALFADAGTGGSVTLTLTLMPNAWH